MSIPEILKLLLLAQYVTNSVFAQTVSLEWRGIEQAYNARFDHKVKYPKNSQI